MVVSTYPMSDTSQVFSFTVFPTISSHLSEEMWAYFTAEIPMFLGGKPCASG